MSDRDTDSPPEGEPLTDAQWRARRASLDERLNQHLTRREVEARAAKGGQGSMQGMAQGLKIASEFISGIAVGALLGYGIDHFLGTSPFALIIFLFLGFGAGILNVVRGAASSTPPKSGEDKAPDRD
ncbi:AtpZ/AtpI family protein [Aureimonas populi]|uniref:ATP synthase protein I n=1 Tax=Aureimonas populi TaxID=1701758 RepID=A0ABW5CIU6_9HYPH|nr:AtpZ/AtpI family protein [Aureimonas populi]